MTDVLFRQTPNGGEIEFVGGQAVMSEGLETAVYLSLFGGNEEDSGGDATIAKQWWGNLIVTEAAQRLRSETQYLLRSLASIPANLRRVEDAVGRDLAWMVQTGLATTVETSARMPRINWIEIRIAIVIDGQEFEVAFTRPWLGEVSS